MLVADPRRNPALGGVPILRTATGPQNVTNQSSESETLRNAKSEIESEQLWSRHDVYSTTTVAGMPLALGFLVISPVNIPKSGPKPHHPWQNLEKTWFSLLFNQFHYH